MKAVGWSVQGSRSEHNEDAFLIDAARQIYLVADGVGSGPDGHEASRAVVDSVMACLRDSDDIAEGIQRGVVVANERVHRLAASKDRAGMASTLVCLWHRGEVIEVFHAGDSRLYRLRGERFQALTADHSKEIERNNQRKEVVTRAIGARPQVDVEHRTHDHYPGDLYALMSDGISDPVEDSVIQSTVSNPGLSMLEKCRTLVRLAEEAGGQDDKTIIIVA
jgi:serine/threonine protein phosphatase PrpC